MAAGDELDVTLELDTEPREVTVPPDFAEALDRDAQARRFFDGLSYSNRLRHVLAIEGAKSDETRQRRIAKSVTALREGTKSSYREQLRLFAADISLRLERVGPLVEVLSTAARSRPRARGAAREDPRRALARTSAPSCMRWPPTGRCASSRKPLSTRSGPSQALICTAC